MFDDILGEKEKVEEETKESLIKAMKYNIKEKDKLIKTLTKRITELERQVEDISSATHAGI